ncbi:zinc finger CCCH domain-containing protein 5-like [Phragmites australis]|uniref:zinc finger CCCH domain-containing protein 5-like n=1 Tax=Phragmites australis TaxID=29695 RepID=UPI002D773F1A|nr:zinc finger CCCH domain-containing protein 5-like [Phragmites australis]
MVSVGSRAGREGKEPPSPRGGPAGRPRIYCHHPFPPRFPVSPLPLAPSVPLQGHGERAPPTGLCAATPWQRSASQPTRPRRPLSPSPHQSPGSRLQCPARRGPENPTTPDPSLSRRKKPPRARAYGTSRDRGRERERGGGGGGVGRKQPRAWQHAGAEKFGTFGIFFLGKFSVRLSFGRGRRLITTSGSLRMEPYAAAKSGGGGGGGPDPGAGLEESMGRLGLGGEDEASAKLPERPGEADCSYYLRTGACGYGERCRYNHPHDRAATVNGVGKTTSTVEYPERPGRPLCEYYVKNGTCKFGSNCKYDHPREGGFAPVVLNSTGYPLRLGEKECSYYIKTGHCKFGATCKFHHPELGVVSETPSMYPPVQPSTISSPHPYPHLANWQMGRPPVVPGSFLPGSYPPMMFPPTVMPMQGWNPYISPMNQVTPAGGQHTVQTGPLYAHQGPTSVVTYGSHYAPLYSSAGPSSSNKQEYDFPERPGQPECEHYMKTGTCKFGATCKYHHPQYFSAPKSNCVLSPLGLPLRPGSQPCAFFAHHGCCKFGPTCKFDHPMGTLSYSPSASSLTDVPVAPYPLSFSVAPMAPSPSYPDLRPQYTVTKESSVNQPAVPGTTYGPVRSISKVYAPHTLIRSPGRSPTSTAASMQAS